MKQQPTAKLSLVSATKNQNVIHKSVWVITSNIWEPSKTRPTFALNVYSEPSQLSNMEIFAKIVNSWKLLSIFAKKSLC